ncbi:Cytochrome c biogenesis protein CcsA [Planococcus massiliensis]|uniref:Cytochrome c biogenesis protein CcsA n=1 Tax=Planococcus massiliensis TaxID=1499687 RepID=A0A098ELB5_9BACL|nr:MULTISPECIES: cytochrome c biogenesis protein CcsA [Planococcus]MCJ1908670.1 cytochrome c biogenesis protein [Planococcus ruber]CEG23104.1 Cytochrome c biogenesis protein CcsA [Planococcus massiliensis]
MADITMARLHEAMVILYAVSLVFYFIDYLYKEKKASRIAMTLLGIVWVLQTVFLALYIIETQRFPILTLFEGIYFYAWLLVTLSLVLRIFYRFDFAVFFINIIGFIFMTIHTFAPVQIERSPVGESLVSELLLIHITFAILSYVAFSLSFVFSALYMILYRLLKKKKWTKQWSNLPSLGQAELGMTISILVGISLLFVSLVLGFQWAVISLNEFSVFDMKIVGSFVLLLVYSWILYRNRKGALSGMPYAMAHIYAFLLLLINFFLGSRLSEFHFWY